MIFWDITLNSRDEDQYLKEDTVSVLLTVRSHIPSLFRYLTELFFSSVPSLRLIWKNLILIRQKLCLKQSFPWYMCYPCYLDFKEFPYIWKYRKRSVYSFIFHKASFYANTFPYQLLDIFGYVYLGRVFSKRVKERSVDCSPIN